MKFIIVLGALLGVTFASTVPKIGFPEDNPLWARVINGKEAKKNEAPYIVSLTQTQSGSHFCGGSILGEKLVLTAAHCIVSNSIYVHAGLHDRNSKGDGQTVKVARTIVHKSYGGGVGPNDIALLILSKPLNLNGKTVVAVELPKRTNQYSNVKCTLYGWGKNNGWGGLPNNLMTVTTNILNAKECRRRLPSNAPIASSNVCSESGGKNGISACNGDSGGPLVVQDNGKTVQVGVVSWGYVPCGEAGYPSVYTCTISHAEWIANNRAIYNV